MTQPTSHGAISARPSRLRSLPPKAQTVPAGASTETVPAGASPETVPVGASTKSAPVAGGPTADGPAGHPLGFDTLNPLSPPEGSPKGQPPESVGNVEAPRAFAGGNRPGAGLVIIPVDAKVASSARENAGAALAGRISKETLAALEQAGGVSYVYDSTFNGNREVVVHASPSFDPDRPYSVLLYNRGINGDNAGSLRNTHIGAMVEELNQAGRNVLLVMPKSPAPMDNWFASPEDAGSMLTESLAAFQAVAGVHLDQKVETWAMGHSGGGKSLFNMAAHPEAPHIARLLLADSTYGNWAGALADTIERRANATGEPAPALAVVVTDHNRDRAKQQLAGRGIPVPMIPGRGRFVGHGGAPAHMLAAILGATPGLAFSRYTPGAGWRQE